MHNGHYMRLDRVIDHYDLGGSAPSGIEAEIRSLSLTAGEKADLLAFLRSLNGRVDETLGQNAAGADLFQAPRTVDHNDRSAQTGPVTDPAYQLQNRPAAAEPQGPVQDPAYERPKQP
jgi:hypothetical protein